MNEIIKRLVEDFFDNVEDVELEDDFSSFNYSIMNTAGEYVDVESSNDNRKNKMFLVLSPMIIINSFECKYNKVDQFIHGIGADLMMNCSSIIYTHSSIRFYFDKMMYSMGTGSDYKVIFHYISPEHYEPDGVTILSRCKISKHKSIYMKYDQFCDAIKYDIPVEKNMDEYYGFIFKKFIEIAPKMTSIDIMKVKEQMNIFSASGYIEYLENFDVISRFKKNSTRKTDKDFFEMFNEVYENDRDYIETFYRDDINNVNTYIDKDYFINLNVSNNKLIYDSTYMRYSVFQNNFCQIMDDNRKVVSILMPFSKFVQALPALYMMFI